MINYDLVKCPFCGGDDLDISRGTKDREGFPTAICCAECGALGPWVYCDEVNTLDAAIAWNQREADPQA